MARATTGRDYYEILGVAPDADDAAIREAFRRLALKYHPDRSTEPDAGARFKEVAEAYAVLSDPRKRADYDARGFAGVAGFSADDLFAGLDVEDLFGPFGIAGGANSIFDRLLHPTARTDRRGPRRGRDIEVVLAVPLATVHDGGTGTVTITRPARCGTCAGTGAEPGTTPRSCPACGGRGRQATRTRQGTFMVRQLATCPECGGRGSVIDRPCPDCGGRGEVTRHDEVTVEVPRGVDDGTALRIPGYGLPGPGSDGEAGDAYVIVQTAPDPRFERRGADLWHAEQIDAVDAVLGTTLTVPTLDGEVPVEVEPGTQPGSTLRLPGRGLPRPGGHGTGDLYVTVAVHVPQVVDARQRRQWERLRSPGRSRP